MSAFAWQASRRDHMIEWKKGLALFVCAASMCIAGTADATMYHARIEADMTDDYKPSDRADFTSARDFHMYFSVDEEAITKNEESSNYESTVYDGITIDAIYTADWVKFTENNAASMSLTNDYDGKSIKLNSSEFTYFETSLDFYYLWLNDNEPFVDGKLKDGLPTFSTEDMRDKIYYTTAVDFENAAGYFYGAIINLEKVEGLPVVPEPGSLALLSLSGLVLLGRKRK